MFLVPVWSTVTSSDISISSSLHCCLMLSTHTLHTLGSGDTWSLSESQLAPTPLATLWNRGDTRQGSELSDTRYNRPLLTYLQLSSSQSIPPLTLTMPPRHRRQRPASRDERTPPIASKQCVPARHIHDAPTRRMPVLTNSAIRLAYVGILGLYAQILVFIIHFFKINAAYFQTPAACLVSGTALRA